MGWRLKAALLGAGGVVVVLVVVASLFYAGVWQINNPSSTRYPVRGVDVSSFQGEIDWPVLAGQDISFVYIKATEGSGSVDERFRANLAGATGTGLRVGAYHFFSFDSPGATQADNFIATVPVTPGMLPPAIDLEFYGEKKTNPPDVASVRGELGVLLTRLHEHYGLRPVIYVPKDTFDLYIAGSFVDYGIWYADWFGTPKPADGREWTFWQYTSRMRLPGYAGPERFIDMNVFCCDKAAFEEYGRG